MFSKTISVQAEQDESKLAADYISFNTGAKFTLIPLHTEIYLR